jgi:hypothetical protein
MARLSSLLLTVLLAVTPTVDVVCRTVCTPNPTAAASPSCHEVASGTGDGMLVPGGTTCQREPVAAVTPADGARNIVAPAPLVTVQVMAFAIVPVSTSANLERQTRSGSSHGYPSPIVLRI